MRRTVLPIIVLFFALIAAGGAGQPAATGSVAGRVKLTARIKGAALPSTAYPTRAVGTSDTHAIPDIKNVVVYLKDIVAREALPPGKAVLRQEHETFVPHVLPITRGSTVEFPNDDPIFHNVFSLSSAAAFDLRRYPRGQSRSQLFPKSGVVKVYCHIHSHMSATILVLDHPYFTIPSADGGFELSNVPPGEYTVAGWHERVGERRARVRIESGKIDKVLTVAHRALQYRYGVNRVFVVNGDQLAVRELKVGDRVGDRIEVVDGVKAGESIALTDVEKLVDGQKVSVGDHAR
jgi:plastocyanin